MRSRLNRRRFLAQSTAAIAAGYFVNPTLAADSAAANEKLNIAVVGTANKGWHNVEQLRSQNIVALCDVDENYLNRAAEQFPQASRHRDRRRHERCNCRQRH